MDATLSPKVKAASTIGAPNSELEASSAGSVGASDLLIVGPGVLGRIIAEKWREEHPGSQIYGQTLTSNHHEELRNMGITPSLKETHVTHKFPYVIFCAPPSGSVDYPSEVRFPISVKQPGSRESLIQCFIKRNRSTQTYYLFLSLSQALADDGKFLLAARKCRRTTRTDYMISLHADDTSKGSETYVGKLRSNFLGTKFVVYDALPSHSGAKMAKSWSTRMVGSKQISPKLPAGNYPVAHISYELNVLGARGPRRMHCVIDTIPASAITPGGVAPTQTYFPLTSVDSSPTLPFFRIKSNYLDKSLSGPLSSQADSSLVLRNKAPRWHEQLQCWCLNFHGRVTVASVKNFQLVASPENCVAGLDPNTRRLSFSLGRWGKMCLGWTTATLYQHSKLSPSASAASTQKSHASKVNVGWLRMISSAEDRV